MKGSHLRLRFFGALIPVFLLVVVLAVFAQLVVHSLARSLPAASDHELRSLQSLNQLVRISREIEIAVAVAKPRERLEESLDRLRELRERMLADGMIVPGAMLDDATVQLESRAWEAVHQPSEVAMERVGNLVKDILAAAAVRSHALEEQLQGRIRETERSARQFSWIMVLIAVVGLVMTGGIAYRLGTRVMGPIEVFIESAERIGRGDLRGLPPYRPDDTFGALATAFRRMAERLAEYRRELSEDVLEERRKMSAVLDRMPSPTFFVDGKSFVEISNQAGEAFLRAPEIGGDLPEPVLRLIERVRTNHEAYLAERIEDALILHVDFDERFYLPRIFPLPLRKDSGAVAVMLFDVTRMRLAADLRSDFVANLNHEMKTPLTSARLALRVLSDQRQSSLSQADRELLDTVKGEIERLVRTLENLREMSGA